MDDWDATAADLNLDYPRPPLAFFTVALLEDGLPGIVLLQPARGGA